MKTLIKTVLFLGLILLPALSLRAQTLDDANRAFAAGQFHTSTEDYRAILERNGYSAPVLFDLGNSYYKEGNFAQAILAYKRAQWLSPGDPDIAANLETAQKKVGLTLPEKERVTTAVHALSATTWTWLASGAWACFCLVIFLRALRPRQSALFSLLAVASMAMLLIAVAGVWFSRVDMSEGVVIDKNVTALISPFPAAQAVFSVSPGESVWVQKSYDNFFLVKNSAGQTGWVSRPQLTLVVPENTRPTSS
jgi:tetratricopeptide (TPR) repeat protein